MSVNIIVNASFLALPMVGTTRVAIEVCRELKKRQVNLTFVSPQKVLHEDVFDEFGTISIGHFAGTFWEQIELPIWLRRKKHCILLNFTNTAPVFYDKNVLALLDIIPLVKPEWVSKKLYYKSRILTPILARRSLAIFTISNYSKKDIIEKLKVAAEKIKVIYCGIKPLTSVLKGENSFSKIPGKYILAVSSLEPRKNFINVIKAFNLLKAQDLSLVLVGPNFQYHMNTLAPFINTSKTIIKGYVTDQELEELYTNSLAFIYPSLYEGFGLPPLEAMQYGCPVVTSNLTSIPEVCGDAVLYADPYSPQDIADKINMLSADENLRKDLQTKGFEKIKEYSWSRTTDLLLECIDSINLDS